MRRAELVVTAFAEQRGVSLVLSPEVGACDPLIISCAGLQHQACLDAHAVARTL